MLTNVQLFDYLKNNYKFRVNGDYEFSVDLNKTSAVMDDIYDKNVDIGTCNLKFRKIKSEDSVKDSDKYSLKIYSYRLDENFFGVGNLSGDVNEGDLIINITGDMPVRLVIRRKICSRLLTLPV